jgi:hypothetical protein
MTRAVIYESEVIYASFPEEYRPTVIYGGTVIYVKNVIYAISESQFAAILRDAHALMRVSSSG